MSPLIATLCTLLNPGSEGAGYSKTLTHVSRYGPSQADVACFKAVKSTPEPAKFPHAYRWYKHLATYEPEFSSLPGDPSKAYTTYGPEKVEGESIPKDAAATKSTAAAEEDEDDDLFGSDDEEEDEEAKKVKEANLAAYKKKKEGKTKPAAKSIVTLDVKPWGKSIPCGLRGRQILEGRI